MYCRANSIPFDVANEISDRLKAYEQDLKHADEEERDAIRLGDYVPAAYQDMVEQSERYMGMIDSISPHPCAHLLCREDVRREIGIIRMNGSGKRKNVYAAFIVGNTAERFGYLKNDLLHVDVVQVNQEVFKRVGIRQPTVNELLE